jgi:cytochrome c oxidase subunit 4
MYMTQDVAAEVRGYLKVFAALLVLTTITVAISYLPLGIKSELVIAMAIAGGKAALVALFFMHLKHERAMIYAALTFTVVLFVALFGLTLWAENYHPVGTRFAPPYQEGVK